MFGGFAKPSLRFLYISRRTESVLTKKSHHALSVGIPFIRVSEQAASVAEGCALARALARPGDRVLVFGSFSTVTAALEWLQLH